MAVAVSRIAAGQYVWKGSIVFFNTRTFFKLLCILKEKGSRRKVSRQGITNYIETFFLLGSRLLSPKTECVQKKKTDKITESCPTTEDFESYETRKF